MKMRPPATPILNIDPYCSVWTEGSGLKNTVHWTGKPNTMRGRVFVDGEEFHAFGQNDRSSQRVPALTQEALEVDAYSTRIVLKNDAIRLRLHFTSPLLVDDLYYASRPVCYCKAAWEALDGKSHEVRMKFSVSEELVLNLKGEGRAYCEPVAIPGVTALRMGKGNQKVLWRSGDDVRIDWGYFYLGVKGEAKTGNEVILERHGELFGIYAEAALSPEALFVFAYDDIDSIQYFGENLKAYWKKDGKTIEEAVAEAVEDYETVLARCNAFSDALKAEATEKGSEKYAELLLLATRQVMAAHKLVVDPEGEVLFISKECFSNGCAATVDVTYPSAPMFLLYNPELLKGMLRPVMKYALGGEWCFDYAPHDVGRYPLVNGQVYNVTRHADGRVEIKEEGQMPVEECGNMIVLFSALCDADGNADFVKPWLPTLKTWSEYLIRYGLDPENQLCTDDFAGHLAHNVNLAVKAIMGIAGYSRILSLVGESAEAEKLMQTARDYAASLIERAANADGSFRLAFDKPDTFSLKYNAVWDKLWGTKLFPESFYRGEIARYKKELLPYGVPLDSRSPYTKSDWLVWVAALTENKADFEALTDPLWLAFHTMRSYAPMTDWYYCDTSHMVGFRHRTVQGGLFLPLMMK